MLYKTFYHMAIALGLTTSLASFTLSTPVQSPSNQAASVVITKPDAYWLGRASLAHFWRK